jgi:LPS-assembly lipoprotein
MTHRLARRSLLFGATGLLAGCGFQPVYMTTATGKAGPARRGLQSITVLRIPERPGQLLRQALQERFQDDGGTPSHYDLLVSFSIAGEGVAIETNNIATHIRFTGTAAYTLLARTPVQTKVTTGSARFYDGLNVYDEQYFAADLETEAIQQRIAENIADQITAQLAVWFRQHPEQAG